MIIWELANGNEDKRLINATTQSVLIGRLLASSAVYCFARKCGR
jgi:hypothetical protein